MLNPEFSTNPRYVEHEQLLIELHRVIAAGGCDSDEAEAIREKMEDCWWGLSSGEKERVGNLSGDLYMLSDEEVFEEVADSATATALEAKLDRALKEKRWEDVLRQLRRRPRNASQEAVALLRSRAYGELGHVAPAALFFDYALGLDRLERSAVKAIYSPPSPSVPVAA